MMATAREKNVKTRLYPPYVWLGTILFAGWIGAVSTDTALAQRGKRTYRQAQLQQSLPAVDVPSPAIEGDVVPLIDRVAPPTPSAGSGTRTFPETIQTDPLPMETQPVPEPIMETPMTVDSGTSGLFDAGSVIEGEPIPEGYPIEQPFCDDGCYGGEGPAPIYSTGTWFRRGRWYSDLEFMYLTRTDPRNVPIARSINLVANSLVPYTLEDLLKLHFAPGARLSFGRLLGRDVANRDHMLELEFIGAFNWDDSRVLRADGGAGSGELDTLLNLPELNSVAPSSVWSPFFDSDQQTFNWDMSYDQLSLNYRLATRPSRDQIAMQPDGQWVRHGAASRMPTFLAGFRYAQLNEGFYNTTIAQSPTIEQVTTPGDPADMVSTEVLETQDDATRGLYSVLTNNDMFGVHFGAESEEKYDEWSWGLRGRIGGLANFAQRRSRIDSRVRGQDDTLIDTEQVRSTDDDGNPLFIDADGMVTIDPMDGEVDNTPLFDTVETFQVDYDDVSLGGEFMNEDFVFVAEVGIFATFQLRPNLHLKTGYNLTYFDGLALATENLQFSNGFTDLNLNGSILLHGGTLGVEATW